MIVLERIQRTCTVVEIVTFISVFPHFFYLAGGHSGDRYLSEQKQLCYISVYICQLKMLFTGVQSEMSYLPVKS